MEWVTTRKCIHRIESRAKELTNETNDVVKVRKFTGRKKGGRRGGERPQSNVKTWHRICSVVVAPLSSVNRCLLTPLTSPHLTAPAFDSPRYPALFLTFLRPSLCETRPSENEKWPALPSRLTHFPAFFFLPGQRNAFLSGRETLSKSGRRSP